MEKLDCCFIGQIVRVQKTFLLHDVKQWSLLTRDYNEVYDREVTLLNLEKPIVPGILSEGLIIEAISSQLLCDTPSVLIQKELVFMEPVTIGDTITAEVEIIEINHEKNWITQRVCCLNEQAVEVIKGKVIIKIL